MCSCLLTHTFYALSLDSSCCIILLNVFPSVPDVSDTLYSLLVMLGEIPVGPTSSYLFFHFLLSIMRMLKEEVEKRYELMKLDLRLVISEA